MGNRVLPLAGGVVCRNMDTTVSRCCVDDPGGTVLTGDFLESIRNCLDFLKVHYFNAVCVFFKLRSCLMDTGCSFSGNWVKIPSRKSETKLTC